MLILYKSWPPKRSLLSSLKKSCDLKNAYPNFKSNSVVLESEEGLIGDEFRDHYELAKKIYWINPKAKILICIRSQYSIIKSFYYLYIKKGGIDSFEEYLETIINNKKFNSLNLCILKSIVMITSL